MRTLIVILLALLPALALAGAQHHLIDLAPAESLQANGTLTTAAALVALALIIHRRSAH